MEKSSLRNQYNLKKTSPRFKSWREIQRFAVQLNRCAFCKRVLNGPTIIDHITPIASGYKYVNNNSNMVVSCKVCNLKKSWAMGVKMPNWVKQRKIKLKKVPYKELLRISKEMRERQ